MNITEQKAHRWLQYQGYKGITFQQRTTPDFITEEGKKFEIKVIRGNTIWFSEGQFQSLRDNAPDTTILVFDNKDTPIAIIPFSEISKGEQFWGNIRIINSLTKPLKSPLLKLSDLGWKQLQEVSLEAEQLGVTIPEFIKMLVNQYLETKRR